eukprot:13638134-Alexandrium_andersonii.AAC.1
MSASLVGSEMCIRDRSPRPALRSLPRGPRPATRTNGISLRGCWRLRPVSYTHLTLPTICSV